MNHVTSIGLDVHARSITAAAFDPITGEVCTKRFGYSPAEVAQWALSFESPKAVYEAGVTGFHLCRELKGLGLECVVGAPSKMQRPPADARRKSDRTDAEYLARLLATHNVVAVMVPDEACEAARNLVRAHDDIRRDLVKAKQRLNLFLMRHGLAFDERRADGAPKAAWTKEHWAWIRRIDLACEPDQDSLALYISEVRHMEAHKRQLERYIRGQAATERWRLRVDSLRCLKGIEVATAFALVVEAQVFARFSSASAYSAWLGLVPSEHSSGERTARGGITKTGNSLCRRLLVEAAWHYARVSASRKEPPSAEVPLSIENHAARGVKRLVKRRRHLKERGKKPTVANIATARELAGWVWAIGCMAEGVQP